MPVGEVKLPSAQTNKQIGDVTYHQKIMNDIISINILELASELAERELKLILGDKSIFQSDNDCIIYTDDAQDVFNELYDKYYSLIERIQEPINK